MFYLDLFKTLQEERVDYVVVGGLAINLHGVERATMDVDLVLAMDDANLKRFLAAAQRLELKPSLPVRIESLCDAKQLDAWAREKHLIAFPLRPAKPSAPTVDVIVRPAVPFERMHRNRIEKDLGGASRPLAGAGRGAPEAQPGRVRRRGGRGRIRHQRALCSDSGVDRRRNQTGGTAETDAVNEAETRALYRRLRSHRLRTRALTHISNTPAADNARMSSQGEAFGIASRQKSSPTSRQKVRSSPRGLGRCGRREVVGMGCTVDAQTNQVSRVSLQNSASDS